MASAAAQRRWRERKRALSKAAELDLQVIEPPLVLVKFPGGRWGRWDAVAGDFIPLEAE